MNYSGLFHSNLKPAMNVICLRYNKPFPKIIHDDMHYYSIKCKDSVCKKIKRKEIELGVSIVGNIDR